MMSVMLAVTITCVVTFNIDNDLAPPSIERPNRIIECSAFGGNPFRFLHGRRFRASEDVASGALGYQRLGEDVQVCLRYNPVSIDRQTMERQRSVIEKIVKLKAGPHSCIRVLIKACDD